MDFLVMINKKNAKIRVVIRQEKGTEFFSIDPTLINFTRLRTRV